VHPALMTAAASPVQTFVVQCLGFAVLVFVIVKLVLPQLGKILGARTHEIEETFKRLDRETQDASKQLAEIKDRLARLTEESKRRLDAALADAEKTKAQLAAESAGQVQAAMAKAVSEIEIEREKAVLELREEASALTLRAAEALVRSTMNEQIHEKLVAQYLKQLESVKNP
jgi:F-type H+-transporting ATPase subunit b